MSDELQTLDEIRRRAAEIGITNLSDSQVAELRDASNVARAKRRALPVAILSPTDEPAHIYTLDAE